MPGKKRRKKKVEKLVDHGDLYNLFGEKSPGSVSFSKEFDRVFTASDIEKAASEKETPNRKPSSLKIRLSSYPPQAEIDLHGMTSESAEHKIRTFLWQSLSDKLKTVRIITGKGLHSDGPAILPDVTETVLREMKLSSSILHYQWEKKEKHKSGSVIVFLK